MENSIIGRDQELKILSEVYESNEPQFLAVYGRRRIGKTYLITEFFKEKGLYFELTGMKDGSTNEQLFQFASQFSSKFNEGNRIPSLKTWGEAFNLLEVAIEKVEKNKKIILFFDEIPWLASPRSRFLNALEHFWNRYLSRNSNAIMIICGSSASWIIRNVVNNRGGLHGRLTRKIRLLPFTLQETEKYLQSRHIELDRKQIIDLYMAFGGVPKYLSYVKKGYSAAENINNVCFAINGQLYSEFDNLYQSLFDHYEHHLAIVKALSKRADGLTKDEILKVAKLTSGGSSSKIIEELVDAGFIIYVPSFHKRRTSGIYRLTDEFSLFYLTWMKENVTIGFESVDSDFWIKKYGSQKWASWSGFAFEALCLKHIRCIKKGLGISGIGSIDSGWRYLPKNSKIKGAQIDLVIDREDKCINLCEMKYSDSAFVIDKSYAEKLQNKKQVFREQTVTKKTLFMTLVTTYGIKKNSHSLPIVDRQLTMDDLFS